MRNLLSLYSVIFGLCQETIFYLHPESKIYDFNSITIDVNGYVPSYSNKYYISNFDPTFEIFGLNGYLFYQSTPSYKILSKITA